MNSIFHRGKTAAGQIRRKLRSLCKIEKTNVKRIGFAPAQSMGRERMGNDI